MSKPVGTYFRHIIPVSARMWRSLGLDSHSRRIGSHGLPPIMFYRQLAMSLNRIQAGAWAVRAAHLNLFAILQSLFRYMIDELAESEVDGVLVQAIRRGGYDPSGIRVTQACERFIELFPPAGMTAAGQDAGRLLSGSTMRRMVLRELLLLQLSAGNPAVDGFRVLVDDEELAQSTSYRGIAANALAALDRRPFVVQLGYTLGVALRAPIKAAPDSLAGQVRFVRDTWHGVLPSDLLAEVSSALDVLLEEERERGWGGEPGPPPVLEFPRSDMRCDSCRGGDSIFGGYDYPEYESFSHDADWMSNVVLMAKMVYVWLDQLSRAHGRSVTRLDQIPDSELDLLADRGFTGLWLIGIWERSPASQRIKQLCGNQDAIASAYSLFDYEVSQDLGGWDALVNLRERAEQRGIRLASDMVPNHTGICSHWVIQHPEWFVQSDYPPFPSYQFTGEDLSCDRNICIQIEDGYWSKHDAAVVFKHCDRRNGRTRYIYHGNDGTSIPWNDTAQLNYLMPEVREAVIQTILHVARNFRIIRFDAAMTLAKKHYQRLWFPVRGLGGGIPSRSGFSMGKDEFDAVFPAEFWREVVDRVAVEAPDTLLLAEAFWMMEGYFVRTLGMHRVYNSAFMNMLRMEENHKYRHTIRNVLEFNPEVLKRFVNFMNNPDEKTAVEQFGSQGKYFGSCVLLSTMPGLPMFGHGQIEGLQEKYGMEYRRAYRDESADEGLVRGHEQWIFPLLHRRWQFSGSENFMLYDFYISGGINDNVFAYSNRSGRHASLIIYHNSYSNTAGWIRDTAGYAVKNGNGEMVICRSNLGSALGLIDERGGYCAFRDHVTGNIFLRKVHDLFECGLYVELGEYQFHVFLDFRQIDDDGEGNWGRLCEVLEGRGVENLDDEFRQVRYRDLIDDFNALISHERFILTDELDCGAIVDSLGDFCRELQRIAPLPLWPFQPETAASRIESRFKRLITLLKSDAADAGSRLLNGFPGRLVASAAECRILMAWMILTEFPPGTLEQFGLDCALRRTDSPDAGVHRVQLLAALLALDGFSVMSEQIFTVHECRSFLAVHEAGGIGWFNRERFDELAEWLAVVGLLNTDMCAMSASGVCDALAAADRRLNTAQHLAASCGYQSARYRSGCSSMHNS